MVDQTFILYLTEIALCVCLFVLYLGWWIHEGSCSWIFKYLVLLYAAIIIDTSVATVCRYRVFKGDYSMLTSWEWSAKEYLFTFCLLLILCHSLYRLLFIKLPKE